MISCKKCESKEVVRNGKVRGLQRYKCKKCCCNFIEGDKRMKKDVAIKKALCVLLYTLSKASFRFLGKLLGVSHTLPYHWIRKEAEGMKDPEISGDIEEIEFDEMWHFLKKKLKKNGSSKPLIVAQGKLLHGFWGIVILQPLESSIKK